jgi:hypothetical protein
MSRAKHSARGHTVISANTVFLNTSPLDGRWLGLRYWSIEVANLVRTLLDARRA